jgi:hypothetical protein
MMMMVVMMMMMMCTGATWKDSQMETIKWHTEPRIPSPALILATMDSKAETPEWG